MLAALCMRGCPLIPEVVGSFVGQVSFSLQSRDEGLREKPSTGRHYEEVRLHEERRARHKNAPILLDDRLGGHLPKEGELHECLFIIIPIH